MYCKYDIYAPPPTPPPTIQTSFTTIVSSPPDTSRNTQIWMASKSFIMQKEVEEMKEKDTHVTPFINHKIRAIQYII